MNIVDVVEILRDQEHQYVYIKNDSGEFSSISYQNFYDDINKLKSRLQELGLKQGQVVGLIAENCYATLVIDFALQSIGCIVAHFPKEFSDDISKHLDFVNSAYLIAHSSYDGLPNQKKEYIGYNFDLRFFGSGIAVENPEPLSAKGCVAYAFSSGTTGKLKCLKISGPGALRSATDFFDKFEKNNNDILMVFLPLSNYQQRLLIYGAIVSRISFCLSNTFDVISAMTSVQPTLLLAPPVFYESALKLAGVRKLTDQPNSTDVDWNAEQREKLRTFFGGRIRILWTGMAPIAKTILETYAHYKLPLYEAYGLTEFGPIASNSPKDHVIGSVGKPLADDYVSLADDGEILVSTAAPLSLGYHKESQAVTEATFKSDGVIATGDVGRFDDKGYLYLVGRKKDIIVTSSGFKVYPEVIEKKLLECPHIGSAVVLGNDMPYLAAYIVVSDVTEEIRRDIEIWIEKVNASLSHSSVIKKWVFDTESFSVEQGTLTRNLKINRKAVESKFASRA